MFDAGLNWSAWFIVSLSLLKLLYLSGTIFIFINLLFVELGTSHLSKMVPNFKYTLICNSQFGSSVKPSVNQVYLITYELSIKSLENAAFHTGFLFFINGIYCVTEALDLLTKYIHGRWVILSIQLTDQCKELQLQGVPHYYSLHQFELHQYDVQFILQTPEQTYPLE